MPATFLRIFLAMLLITVLFPTLLVAAETKPNRIVILVDGRSFLPVLLGNYKRLRNTSFEPYQMFNLATDRHENHPIPRQTAPKKYAERFHDLMLHSNQAARSPLQREHP